MFYRRYLSRMTSHGTRNLAAAALFATLLPLAAARGEDRPSTPVPSRGLDLLTHTRLRLPKYDKSLLNCVSCHADGGTNPQALPWTGVAAKYPRYNPRAGRVLDLADRVNECFRRSLNGEALPKKSPAMMDILAYLSSLPKTPTTKAAGASAADRVGPADEPAGARLYAQRCARCHGKDGAGLRDPDDDPDGEIPPLWGPGSFNLGAGMARLHTLERFIRANMPQGAACNLTAQEARDVAAFVAFQPRPDFPDKSADWPKGGKPVDARY